MVALAGHDSAADDARRCVQGQAWSRQVNEQIHRLRERTPERADVCEIVCECVDPNCVAPLEVPRSGYEEVRRFPTRFLVAPGHHSERLERVVEECTGYSVVEKTGAGAASALRLDPRRPGGPDVFG